MTSELEPTIATQWKVLYTDYRLKRLKVNWWRDISCAHARWPNVWLNQRNEKKKKQKEGWAKRLFGRVRPLYSWLEQETAVSKHCTQWLAHRGRTEGISGGGGVVDEQCSDTVAPPFQYHHWRWLAQTYSVHSAKGSIHRWAVHIRWCLCMSC